MLSVNRWVEIPSDSFRIAPSRVLSARIFAAGLHFCVLVHGGFGLQLFTDPVCISDAGVTGIVSTQGLTNCLTLHYRRLQVCSSRRIIMATLLVVVGSVCYKHLPVPSTSDKPVCRVVPAAARPVTHPKSGLSSGVTIPFNLTQC